LGPIAINPEGSRNSPTLRDGPKAAVPGMLASITSFRRVAPFVSAIRLISMIPPTVAKDLVGTTVIAHGMPA